MQRIKDFLTKEVWKRDIDETVEDALSVYRFIIGKMPEQIKAKQRATLMERRMGHIGFPTGVIHSLDKLVSYCNKNGLDVVPVNDELVSYCEEHNIDFTPTKPENKDDICVLTRLDKALCQLTYDSKGNYKSLSAEFTVKTD